MEDGQVVFGQYLVVAVGMIQAAVIRDCPDRYTYPFSFIPWLFNVTDNEEILLELKARKFVVFSSLIQI